MPLALSSPFGLGTGAFLCSFNVSLSSTTCHVNMHTINCKATSKIAKSKVIVNKPRKEIKRNHKNTLTIKKAKKKKKRNTKQM